MALYRVQGNGKAPVGLQVGDEVVTGGGTYRILGVNADGSYRSSLSNKYQTIYNYRGNYGTPSAGQTDAAQVRTPGYTPSGAASEAKAALDRVLAEKPGSYTSRWDKELDTLYDQIANRKAFSYDLGSDPLYRQYREQYQSAGRLAMENTMGAAAALTGGYGSSYSQQAGQQSYNAYLQKLNEVVPDLYAQARSQYDREGAALSERYALISSREKSDYDRYRDQVTDYYAALSDARSAYQSEAQRSETLALQYAKLANDNYWNELNYRSDREDAANAQYWKQLISDYSRTLVVYYVLSFVYAAVFFPLYARFGGGKGGAGPAEGGADGQDEGQADKTFILPCQRQRRKAQQNSARHGAPRRDQLKKPGGGEQMTKLPGAKPSPRIAGGVLRWYAGDTFSVTLALELRDQDGETVSVGASDSLTVSFFDASHTPVHTFQFDRVTGGQATLTFDDTVSAKFPRGAYFYDILYTHGDKTTLARDNHAAAE